MPVTLLAVLAAGLILVLVPNSDNDGWFAYAPLSEQQMATGTLLFLGVRAWVGLSLAAAALLGLAFWSGFRAGRQRIQRRTHH